MSTTPILDLAQDPPAPRSTTWKTLISLAIGAGIGLAGKLIAMGLPGINLLLWIPCLYIAIAIHELGHLAVGKLTGMSPGGIVAGGIVAMKTGDRWTIRFDRRRILGGGLAIPLPAKGEFRLNGFCWMVAAGPIASVLFTLACWLAFVKYGSGTWDWIGSCFWASLVGLPSLIPMSTGIHKSDAARVWLLLMRQEQARAWMAAVAVQAENMKGIRPREWDSALVRQMLADPQPGSGRVFPELMAYYRCVDEANETAACEQLESALAASGGAGKAVRQAPFLKAAEANALLNLSSGRARTWLERALKLRTPESAACADGAIAISEGRYEDAIRDIARTRAFFARVQIDSGLARFAKERLYERERQCEEALHAAHVG